MDLWVVGAAAAAGYIAKYWQNLSKDRANSLELSSGTSTCEKPETSSSPFHKLIRRRKQVEDTLTNGRHFSDGGFSDMYQLDGASDTEAASTSSFGERIVRLRTYDDCNVFSMSKLTPGFSVNENLKENEGGNGLNGNIDDSSGNPCTVEMNSYYCSGKSSLRTKHSGSHVVKPLSSLDSCLMAQLYREHARTEEYLLSALRSPSTTMKPLLITDGTQIISRADRDSLSAQTANDNNRWHKEEIVCGVPPLPKIGFSDHLKKIKSKRGKGQNERSSSSQKHLQSLNGSHDGTVLFCLGVSIGIISSLIASGREVNQLKEVLKHTQNLVQDLQEELEMKDSMTVKQLANENNESQDTCDNSFHYRASNPHLLIQNVNDSTNKIGVAAAFSPKKNSAFLLIGGVKLYTQDISDGSDGESPYESSESSEQGQQVVSQSDDTEDTSDCETDVDDEVAKDYLEGIGGNSVLLNAKWLVENDLGDSDEDSSSSDCFDETLKKLSGIALEEASRSYGMKKPQSSKYHFSSARDVSPHLNDFMLVKDPRTISAKKKPVARLPQSWPSEAQRSKSFRNFPGEKKKHHKEMIADKRRRRMLARGIDLGKLNKKLEQIVLDEVDIFSFQPMHPRDCSQVRRLAAIYCLRSGTQGSRKKSFVTVSRTQYTCMPSASDKLRLEKLIGAADDNADFVVNEGSRTKSASADRNRNKKSPRGSGGRNCLFANQPVSFVSSGVMQSGVVETITVDSQEINETGENKDASCSSKFGAFEVHTTGFGSKMMAKMGFIEGGGLGKDGQGMAQPIEVTQRPKSLGLGVDFSNISSDSVKDKPQSSGTGTSGKHSKTQNLGAFEKHTKGFGSKMMARMGFIEGKGLGKDSQGIVNPLVAVRRPKARGLGAESRH